MLNDHNTTLEVEKEDEKEEEGGGGDEMTLFSVSHYNHVVAVVVAFGGI